VTEIKGLEERLQKIESILEKVADGDFYQKIDVGSENDSLSNLEIGINFMLLDLQAMEAKNKERERELLAKAEEIEEKLRTIQEQGQVIKDLSTPVLEVWEHILVLPVIGIVDTDRCMAIMNSLLSSIVDKQSKCVIIDITGVEIVDTRTADFFLKLSRSASLLGAHCILTGLQPAVAQTLVEIGTNLTELQTLRTLKDGLKASLSYLRQSDTSL